MRPIHADGQAPLDSVSHLRMLDEHIPYRLSLVRDGLRPHWQSPCQHTNQAFEAGALSGRMILAFLGIQLAGSGDVRNSRRHSVAKANMTDDVLAVDVGGRFADVEALTPAERITLATFINGINKACAHFTVGSEHGLTIEIYRDAAAIIFRLVEECFPNESSKWPRMPSY